ncbi:MAG: S53 family peptidase [Thermoplasmata archaeon]
MSDSEAYSELQTSHREPMRGARPLGPAYSNEEVAVTLLLRRGSPSDSFHSALSHATQRLGDRRIVSREEFAHVHGARKGDIEAVREFAHRHHLDVIEESAARRTVRVSGAVERLEAAFRVKLERFGYAGGTYRGRTGAIQLPRELREIVVGVFGLDNRPQARTHFRQVVRASSTDVSYTPLQLAQAYDFPAGPDGSGECVGLVELGGGFQPADLSTFFQSLGIVAPTVTAVSVDGGANAPTGDSNGPDAEVELDIEVAGALAPGAKIAVYFAPNTDQGFLDAVTTAIHDTTLHPSIISISWGSPEGTWTTQARNALNAACEEAATLGVTILVAAGDQGADDGDDSGTPTVDFPASSPYALGCGGTRLVASAGSGGPEETVWNDLAYGEGATGGGVSEIFALPSYQDGLRVPAAPNGFVGRGVPDVAGDADPSTGYQLYIDGTASVLGGTSAVAPLWAGLIARINQSVGAPLGFAGPELYAASLRTAFREITSGNNGGYSAGPGWNACTGLGTPDGSAILAGIRAEIKSGALPSPI